MGIYRYGYMREQVCFFHLFGKKRPARGL